MFLGLFGRLNTIISLELYLPIMLTTVHKKWRAGIYLIFDFLYVDLIIMLVTV